MSKGVSVILDEVESLDRLSIFELKYNAADKACKSEFSERVRDLEKRIIKSIGYKLYQRIKLSREYEELFAANLEVFHGVNKARKNEISGYDLNRLNEIRSQKKQNLDQKFFGGKLKEIKIDDGGKKI